MRSHLETNLNQVVVAAFFCVVLLATGCHSQSDGGSQHSAPEVEVEQVVSKSIQAWDEYNGRINAVDSVEIRPRVTGYIDKIKFREGELVKQGDLLIVIDQRPYRAALETAQAALQKATATRDLAKEQNRRAHSLIEAKAISTEEFDARQAELIQGQADVRAAEAAVINAKLDLDFTEVKAPISGRVGRAMLTLGNLAVADQSILATVVSQDPVYVYFDCDERNYLRYLTGRGGQAPNAKGQSVYVALANEEKFSYVAKVDFLDNQVDSETGTIKARAVLPNSDRRFIPGLYARVKFPSGGQINAITLDEKAVQTDQDRNYVYVVGKDNTAVRKDVVIGRLIDGRRIILGGLAVGDRVVVNGIQKIFFPGMPIKPVAKSGNTVNANTSIN